MNDSLIFEFLTHFTLSNSSYCQKHLAASTQREGCTCCVFVVEFIDLGITVRVCVVQHVSFFSFLVSAIGRYSWILVMRCVLQL